MSATDRTEFRTDPVTDAAPHRPLRTPRAAEVARGPRGADGLARVEFLPSARPRVCGPGRKERDYRDRIAALEHRVDDAQRELDTARLVERGTNRLVDRLELDVERARQLERRLILALGAQQAQNEALRARLARYERLEAGAASNDPLDDLGA